MYIVRTFILHLLIASTYIGYLNYKFVVSEKPNPIGSGLGQILLMFIHFIATLIIVSFFGKKSKEGFSQSSKMIIHGATIILLFIMNIVVSESISKWLWAMREGS